MSDAALGIDVRLPIGGLFTALGLIVGGYGIATNGNAGDYQRSLGTNINLWWGIVMLVFGLAMIALARSARRHPSAIREAMETPEGRDTERREHVLGLEKEKR